MSELLLLISSFRWIFFRWVVTVVMLINSTSAISLLVNPLMINLIISFSCLDIRNLLTIEGDDHTKFLCDLQGFLTMQFKLKTPEVSSVYTLISANDAVERDPKAWTYEGSQDGVNWTELHRVSNFFFEERYQQKVFRCTNTVAYQYYRINITELRSGGTFQLAEWTINKSK